jgi:hypothetical protein
VPSVSIRVNAVENVITSCKFAISDFIFSARGIVCTSISTTFANNGFIERGDFPGYFTTIAGSHNRHGNLLGFSWDFSV